MVVLILVAGLSMLMACTRENKEALAAKIYANNSVVAEQEVSNTVQTTPEPEQANVKFADNTVIQNADITDVTPSPNATPNYFYTENQPSQLFNINNSQDTVIIGQKGIKVFVPANSFVLDDPNATVSLELVEYTNLTDMLLANLTTTSNGQLIETGGTVYLNATANGKQVLLQAGKTVQLAFPTAKALPGMQTFYGDVVTTPTNTVKSVNWQTGSPEGTNWLNVTEYGTYKPQTYYYKVRFPDTLVDKGFKLYPLHGKERPRSAYFSNDSMYEDMLSYFADKLEIPDSILQTLQGNNLKMTLKVDSFGKVHAVYISPIKNFEYNRNYRTKEFLAFRQLKRTMRKLTKELSYPLEYWGDPNSIYNKYTLILKIDSSGTNIREVKTGQELEYAGNRMYYACYSKAQMDSLSKINANYYLLTTNRLGYINCDRFLRYSPDKLTTMKIPIKADNNRVVNVIFPGISSVMQAYSYAGGYATANVPKDTQVQILVTETRDDKSYYAIKAATTSEVVTNFDFKPYDKAQMKEDLEIALK